jgi:hypothetical protein
VSEGFGANIGHRIHIEGLVAEAFRPDGADTSAEEVRHHVDRVVTRITAEHDLLAWQHPIDAGAGGRASCRGRLGGDAIAVFDMLHRMGDPEVRSMAAVAQLARNCLYWWPFDGLIVLTERLHEPDHCPFA